MGHEGDVRKQARIASMRGVEESPRMWLGRYTEGGVGEWAEQFMMFGAKNVELKM